MAVGGYFYFNFINYYKYNLEQSLPLTASSTSEIQDKMARARFDLLDGMPLSPQASAPSTSDVCLFLYISLMYNSLDMEEEELMCEHIC